MTTDTRPVWDAFDETFRAFDKTMAKAGKLFQEQRSKPAAATTQDGHTLRFRSKSWAERWKLMRTFFGMGWQVLFTGNTEFQFKKK